MDTWTAEQFGISGRTALVTGGSQGIGLMIARGLVLAGVRVFIAARAADVCEAAAAQLNTLGARSGGGKCVALPGDVASSVGRTDLVARLGDHTASLDILVNNAGRSWLAPIESVPEVGWDKVLDLNAKTPFFLVQALLPLLELAAQVSPPSRVINIGSIEGFWHSGKPLYSYAASKAALHHLSSALAKDLGSRSITVNAIAPGPFESEMAAPALAHERDAFVRATPLRRIGEPADIAGAVQFLASRAGAFVTGVTLIVDGGLHL